MKTETEQNHLTNTQLQDVLQFAQGLYQQLNFYTPDLVHKSLVDINNNPIAPTYDNIVSALKDYKNQSDTLDGYTEFMSVWDFIFNRTIEYYAGLLSFDVRYTCKNYTEVSDFNSKEYASDIKIVHKFLDNFDCKAEFRKVLREVLRHEVYYSWLRSDMDSPNPKMTLQSMPQQFCTIDGYWQMGMTYSFDMSYFTDRLAVDIDMYPSVFKNKLAELNNGKRDNYIPSTTMRRDGTYAYWTQVSPSDGAWVWKFDDTNFSTVPFFAGLLKNLIRNEDTAKLQYDKDMMSAYAILVGELRLLDNVKSGATKNQFAIDPKTVGEFMQLVANGLKNNIKVAAVPFEEAEWRQFSDSNPDMYSNTVKSNSGMLAGAGRTIYSTDKLSNAELEAAISNDYHLVSKMYSQFTNFLDFYVNKKTRKFKFKFTVTGCTQPIIRQREFDNLMKMADVGFVMNSTFYAAALGVAPQEFDRALEEGHNSKMLKNLSQLISIHTSSGDTVGAPKKDSNRVSESEENNRDVGGE